MVEWKETKHTFLVWCSGFSSFRFFHRSSVSHHLSHFQQFSSLLSPICVRNSDSLIIFHSLVQLRPQEINYRTTYLSVSIAAFLAGFKYWSFSKSAFYLPFFFYNLKHRSLSSAAISDWRLHSSPSLILQSCKGIVACLFVHFRDKYSIFVINPN